MSDTPFDNRTPERTEAQPPDTVAAFLRLLHAPGDVFEVRAPKLDGYNTASGYFDDPDAAARALADARLDGRTNVYVTMNPCDPALLARAARRIVPKAKDTTTDAHIRARRWLLVDIDPVRPTGISATAGESEAARQTARAVWTHLGELGWPEPVVTMSGNGCGLLYRVDLPNDARSAELVRGVLAYLGERFDTPAVSIDQTVYNAARITALIGTRKVKGDDTPERPHRRTAILRQPAELVPVPAELLDALVPASEPAPPAGQGYRLTIGGRARPLPELLDAAAVAYRTGKLAGGWQWYDLRDCPWHPGEDQWTCGVAQDAGGKYGQHCYHNRGTGKSWADWRRALGLPEPLGDGTYVGTTAAAGTAVKVQTNSAPKIAAPQRLVQYALATGPLLFRDGAGTTYMRTDIGGCAQVHPIASAQVAGWLRNLMWDRENGRVAERDAVRQATEMLDAQAQHGAVLPVYLRVGRLEDGGIALDLGRDDWTAAIVRPDGWTVAPHPVMFRRTATTGPLPIPTPGGKLDGLRGVLNLSDETQWRLLVGFLLGAIQPDGPYVGLVVTGEAGAAKTFAARLVRRMIDPTPDGGEVLSFPRKEDDFAAQVSGAWIAGYDNVSGLKPEQADWLAKLSTGYSDVRRRLYTDNESHAVTARRPFVVTGIEVSDRSDLLQRAIMLTLPALAKGYTVESALFRDFEAAWPGALAGLLDAAAASLAGWRALPEEGWLARMAEHIRWVTAAEAQLGWPERWYENAIAAAQADALTGALEAVAWWPALRELRTDFPDGWEGTYLDLLEALRHKAENTYGRLPDNGFGWPKTGQGMAAAIRRHMPELRREGLRLATITASHREGRRIALTWATKPENPANPAPADTPEPAGGPVPVGTMGTFGDIVFPTKRDERKEEGKGDPGEPETRPPHKERLSPLSPSAPTGAAPGDGDGGVKPPCFAVADTYRSHSDTHYRLAGGGWGCRSCAGAGAA